jgi:hypothetical protein
MKTRVFGIWNLGVGLVAMLLSANCLAASSTPERTKEPAATAEAESGADADQAMEAANTGSTATNDISTARFQPVAAEKPLPVNIQPGRPLAQIVKLANSGIEENVLMAYVTNSTSTFNLNAEEIIYLKDIGVPDMVVTAMIARDQVLRESSVAANAPAPEPAPPQSPGDVAPQPEPGAQYSPEPAPAAAEVASDAGFYNALSPYGNWVDVEGYGRCWQPTVGVINTGWQPYYDSGRWVYSDCGWYWVSDYSWGWAPFHYGRWFRHNHLGWCWMPDTVWGASWVSWRYTDDYCGWAPLPPGAYFTVGIGLTFHGRRVGHFDDCGLRPSHYRFVAWNHFHDRDYHHDRLPPRVRDRVFEHSVVATGFTGDTHKINNDGLPPQKVAAATGTQVRRVAVREVPGTVSLGGRGERFDPGNRAVTVYRPGLGQTTTKPAGKPVNATSSPRTDVRPTPPIILRGAQNSASKETAPASSLVVIGRKNPDGSQTITRSTVPPASTRPLQNSATPWADNEFARQTPNERWVQGGSGSYQSPVYVPRNGTSYQNGTPAYQYQRPNTGVAPVTPSYQPSARSAPVTAPRYGTESSPQRSYSAPAQPAPSRPQVTEARPAPAAPQRAAPTQSGGRNQR